MAKSVKGEEFVEKGALSQHIAETQKLIELYDKWDERIKEVAKDNKVIIEQLKTTNVKDVERLSKAQKEVNTATSNGSKIAKEKAKLEENLARLRSKEGRDIEARKIQLQEQRKAIRDTIKLNRQQEGSIEQLRRKLSLVTDAWKRLSREERENTKRGRRIVESKRKLTEELTRLEKKTGDSRRQVGQYENALGSLGGKMRTVTSYAQGLGVALGGGAIVSGIFNMNKELAKAEQTARTLFNVSNAGATQLAQNATKIAKIYGEDVNEVLRTANALQKEFGISEQESLNLIEQGFEKGVNVTGEMLENVKEYSTQLRLAGLSAEETFAFLSKAQEQGVFNDKGVDAIKEATLSLREMTVPAQEALQAIGLSSTKIQKEINDGTKTYFEVIQEISAKTKEFGEDSQQAGMVLADIFKGAGEDAGQFIFQLDEMDVNFENIDSTLTPFQKSVNSLTESWYDYIFGINEAGGLSNKLTGIMSFLANNLSTIIGVIGKLIAIYAIWIIRQKVLNSGMIDYIKNIPKAVAGTKNLSKNMSSGAGNASKFGKMLKGIGWTALIGLASELAFAFWDIASGANEAAFQSEVFNRAQKEGRRQAEEFTSQRTESIDKLIKKGEQELALLREKGATEEEIAEKELELRNKIADARREARRDVQIEISVIESQQSAQLDMLEKLGVDLENLPEQLKDAGGSWDTFVNNFDTSLYDVIGQGIFGPAFGSEERKNAAEINKQFEQSSIEIQKLLALRKEDKKLTEEISDDLFEVNRTELARRNTAKQTTRELKDQAKAIEDFTKQQRNLFESQIKSRGDDEGLIRLESDKKIIELEEFKREYIRAKKEMFGADVEINEQELEAFKDLRNDIEEELKKSLQEMEREKRLEMFETDKELAELDLQILENQMQRELDLVKGMDEKAVAERNKIRVKYMEERANLINEIAYMEIQALEEEIQMWEQSGEPISRKKIQALEKEIKLIKQKTQQKGQTIAQEKEEVQTVDQLTQSYSNFTQVFEEFSNMRQEKLDEEIRKIDEFIDASKKRESELSELRAKEGADVAESLAFEQQKQAEAQAQREELERKKRRTELATAVINLVSSKIEQGSTNPTGEAFQEIASIQSFIQALPTFWGGTDTTIGDAVGMKYSNDRDGVIVRADPSEMILNKDKVDELRGMGITRTDDIVNVAKMWKQSGAIQYNNDYNVVKQTAPIFNSKVMERELKGLKSENEQIKGYLKSINEKPVQVFDVKKMGDYVDLISKKVEGNKTTRTYKRFR